MRIGDLITFEGRRHVVRGVTPFSVTPFRVLLEDPETRRTFWAEWPAGDAVERTALRVAGRAPDDATAAGGAATPPAAES